MDTLAELLAGLAVEHGTRVALVEGDRTLTFDGLAAAAGALAGELTGWGVGRGDVVALWLPNVLEYLVAEFALGALGAAALGVNTRYGEHERGAPGGARPAGRRWSCRTGSWTSTSSASCRGRARGSGWSGRRRTRTSTGSTSAAGRTGCPIQPRATRGRAARRAACGRAAAHGPGGRPVAYFTTSGSTGAPKLAGHPQSAVVEHAVNVARAFDMRPGDAVHLALPLCGVFGFSAAFGMLAAGGTCVLEPVFDAGRMARDVGTHQITHLVGGDDLLGSLMALDPPAWPACRRGAVADFGGRAMDVARWADEPGDRPVRGVRLLGAVRADLDVARGAAPRTSGSPRAGCRCRRGSRCGPSTRRPARSARPGRPVSCSSVATPSRRATSAGPRSRSTPEGWFASGDLGSTTAAGAFHYRCRAGDALRLRGFLVEPAEIESFLLEQDGVDGAKVVGADGVAVAFVTLRPGAVVTAADLHDRCQSSLAAFKVPARIEVLDAFPVTTGTNGTKIRAAELRERAPSCCA